MLSSTGEPLCVLDLLSSLFTRMVEHIKREKNTIITKITLTIKAMQNVLGSLSVKMH